MSKTKLSVVTILWSLFFSNAAFALQGPNAHFDTDQSVVLNVKEIVNFALSIEGDAEYVVVYCHTDSRASEEYNKKLAQRRCESVKKLLEDHNLPVHAYVVEGESELLVSEKAKRKDDRYGRMGINRRATIMYSLKTPDPVTVTTVVEKEVFKRHRFTIAGGFAPSGVKNAKQIGPNKFHVKEDFDFELGGSYSYRLNRTWNLGVAGYSNKSGFVHLGWDF